MENPSTTSTLTRRTNTVLIVLFMGLLVAPALDRFFHLDPTPPANENRAVIGYPSLPTGFHGLQAYLSAQEAYFNDNFGCRNVLVKWHSKIKRRVFKDQSASKALIGKQGWLYFTEKQMIEHYSGQLQFTKTQLLDWQKLLEKRRDWLARRGIPYVFVITPDKHTVYPEHLPSWIAKIRPETKLDQFVAHMRENSTVPVLDLRQVVLEAKKSNPTYLKTDTHWNFYGAFAGYDELVRTLARQVPALKLEPIPLDAFTLTNKHEPGGDIARILGPGMTETNAYTITHRPEPARFTVTEAPKDHPTDPVFSTNPAATGSLVLFHDSFAGAWYPFLGYNFNRITYLWQYDMDSGWIEREKPSIVVTEMLERFLNTEDPRKMMLKEGLD